MKLLEKEYIQNLKNCSFNFQKQEIEVCEYFFLELRKLERLIWEKSPNKLYETQWALLGIISRSYQLALSSIQQIYSKNFNGYYCTIRGLMETLAGIIWANEKNDRLSSFVQFTQLSIGKIMNASYKKYPKLKTLYSKLSEVAHPNRSSHLLSPSIDKNIIGFMTPFELDFSDYFAKEKISILIFLLITIIDELKITLSTNETIAKGKIIASIKQDLSGSY